MHITLATKSHVWQIQTDSQMSNTNAIFENKLSKCERIIRCSVLLFCCRKKTEKVAIPSRLSFGLRVFHSPLMNEGRSAYLAGPHDLGKQNSRS